MPVHHNGTQSLPMNALKEIPTPGEHARRITALAKESGHVEGYQLDDGRVISKKEGVELARNGGISGVGISNRKGNEYLKSLPDNTEDNNLSHLPSIPWEQH